MCLDYHNEVKISLAILIFHLIDKSRKKSSTILIEFSPNFEIVLVQKWTQAESLNLSGISSLSNPNERIFKTFMAFSEYMNLLHPKVGVFWQFGGFLEIYEVYLIGDHFLSKRVLM